MLDQVPIVGDGVHYVSHGTPVREDGTQAYISVCRAATVTETHGETVGLCVTNPAGLFFHQIVDGGCSHDEGTKAGGTWHWPERT